MASAGYTVVHSAFREYPGESESMVRDMADTRCRKFQFYSIASSGSLRYYTDADCKITYLVAFTILVSVVPCSHDKLRIVLSATMLN